MALDLPALETFIGALVEDDGTGTTGTVYNTAFWTSVRQNIEQSANFPVRSVSGAHTASASTDAVILCNAGGGAFTVSLPTAVGNTGLFFWIKKTDSGDNAVTINPNGAQTVDGETTHALEDEDQSVLVISDGANWEIVGGGAPPLAADDIPDLPASKVTSGQFNTARIPSLAASKVTSGEFATARIPSLAASKITSGQFATARIPSLAASKVTSGAFNTARIPNLSATKVTSGEFNAARLGASQGTAGRVLTDDGSGGADWLPLPFNGIGRYNPAAVMGPAQVIDPFSFTPPVTGTYLISFGMLTVTAGGFTYYLHFDGTDVLSFGTNFRSMGFTYSLTGGTEIEVGLRMNQDRLVTGAFWSVVPSP